MGEEALFYIYIYIFPPEMGASSEVKNGNRHTRLGGQNPEPTLFIILTCLLHIHHILDGPHIVLLILIQFGL